MPINRISQTKYNSRLLADRLGLYIPYQPLTDNDDDDRSTERSTSEKADIHMTALDLFNPIQDSLLLNNHHFFSSIGEENNNNYCAASPPQTLRNTSSLMDDASSPESPTSVASLKRIDIDAATKSLRKLSSSSTATTAKTTTTTARGRVSFQSEAQIIEIPSHRDYAPQVRDLLWSSNLQIAKGVERNTLEFMADGWDWRKAAEEDVMVQVSAGEFVHPATWMRFAPVRPLRERRRKTSKYLKTAVVNFQKHQQQQQSTSCSKAVALQQRQQKASSSSKNKTTTSISTSSTTTTTISSKRQTKSKCQPIENIMCQSLMLMA